MKKLIITLLSVLAVAVPAIASASTDHYYFRNSQPEYKNDASNYAPFNVSCGLAGSSGMSASWNLTDSMSALNYGLRNADSSKYGYSATYTAPRDVSMFVFGTDIDQTDVSGSTLTVKYKDAGVKSLWFGETDGNETEVRYCGSVTVLPPYVPVVKVLPNGVSLTF